MYRREILKPPIPLSELWPFLTNHPEFMFVFMDGKACLTYDTDVDSVVYLFGLFNQSAGKQYNTYVAKVALSASMN
jgi:hypothetical protein